MKDNELKLVVGGASYTSGNFINSLVRIINFFLELGRNVGSAINYAKNRRTC